MTLPSPFAESTLGINFTLEQASDSLLQLTNWTERYKQLFKLAEKITPLDEQWRTDNNLIQGCESPVWLLHHLDKKQQKHYFVADSDSKIIKGLLVLILCSCNGQHAEKISSIKIEPMLKQFDLGKYVTPSRTNGLISVVSRIQSYC